MRGGRPVEEATSDGDFGAILNQHRAAMLRIAVNIVVSRDEAEDVVQQCMLKAWAGRSTIQNVRAMTTWLTRVVVNEAYDVLRKRRRQSQLLADRRREGPVDVGNCAESVDLRDALLHALSQVDSDEREVVTLRFLHGMSGRETAELLSLDEPQVSRLLHRGLDRMRPLVAVWHSISSGPNGRY